MKLLLDPELPALGALPVTSEWSRVPAVEASIS